MLPRKGRDKRILLRSVIATIAVLLVATYRTCQAYHVGDVVDTDLLIDSVRTDGLRSQMPMFGYGRYVQFDVPPAAKTFALQFEDGLWALPVTLLSKSGGGKLPWQFLERIQVQFVYSKSGTGAIHAVVAKNVVYSSEQRSTFVVEYLWMEEESVYLSSGQAVMFLAVFISCIFALLVSCGIIGNNDIMASAGVGGQASSSSSVPKWD
jgi:hypothetical protein